MENDNPWVDPLLITDVSCQQKMNNNHNNSVAIPSLQISKMANPVEFRSSFTPDVSLTNENQRAINVEDVSDPISNDVTNGRSMLRLSLASPDLVICAESPEFWRRYDLDSTEILKGACSDVSLENGINGSQYGVENLDAKQTSKEVVYAESSFELLPQPLVDESLLKGAVPVISINSGSASSVISGGVEFLEDSCFDGGDTTSIDTDFTVGVGEEFSLYRTARLGNFTYYFRTYESGVYIIDLHFAENLFTEGPPGLRVFDVFIQEEKVISCLDIYARVGAHCPLVIPDLKTYAGGDEGLTIRFDGIIGSPIVCGISIRKISAAYCGETELVKLMGISKIPQRKFPKGDEDYKMEENNMNAKIDEGQEIEVNEWQKAELIETKRALEVLKRENEQKSKECQEAWKSLQELQNELMRKSMHVGSLAFAVEGQVREKSRWFSCLNALTRKLKILKMEQIKLAEEASSYKKCLGDMTAMSSIVLSKLNQQVELHEDLKVKYIKGAKERRELYNKILELKGNIRVFCRCRPLNGEEIDNGALTAIDFGPDSELTVKCNGAIRKSFKFDAVFGPQADQVDIFEETAPFATSVLDGYNVCIFAYGQTGSGKTFTMEGTDEARGVNFRTLEELFRIIEDRNKQFRYEICVSALEVYNEQIRDLLVPGSHSGVAAKRLEIRQGGEGIHNVPGLVEASVKNMNEVWEVLQTGSNARAVGSTNANEHSSRSHCIHCVMVKGENLLNGECTRSKLWLVDLAGSERIAKTEVQGERLKETQNINRSLSALGDVISALATKSPHVPFRNSKLTHLLQDSLGGDSKTLMLVQISPTENDLSETLCSLNFASRVRGIELGPAKKQFDSTELIRYKQLVEKTKQDLKLKEVQAKKMEDTIHGLDMKVKDKDMKNKNLQDKIKELEAQLLVERKLARQHVDSKLAEQQQQIKQQLEDPNSVLRPPVASRPSGIQKNLNDGKDQANLSRPLAENNVYKCSAAAPDSLSKYSNFPEKENNPETAELPIPKRTGRASICTTVQKIPASSAPRRNSLIPLPTLPSSGKLAPPVMALTPIHAIDEEDKGLVEPKCKPEHENGSKKLASILRRSVQKKMRSKSPKQHVRRGGVNVGMEKVRVSIGSRGRIANRVLNGNGRRVGKDIQQKQSHREKERGWNTGTAVRAAVI